jgi:hypothetical protein
MSTSPKSINRQRGRAVLTALRREFAELDIEFGAEGSDPRVLEIFITRSGASLLDPSHGRHECAIPEERNLDGFLLTEEAAAIRARMIDITRSTLDADAASLFLTVGVEERCIRGWANRLEDELNPPPPPPSIGPILPSRRLKRWLSENRNLALMRFDFRPEYVEDGLALRILRKGRNTFSWHVPTSSALGPPVQRIEPAFTRCDGTQLVIETSPGRWIVAKKG